MSEGQSHRTDDKLLSELLATHEPDNLTLPVVDVYNHSRNILLRTMEQANKGDDLKENPKKDTTDTQNQGSNTQIQYDIAKLSSVQSSKIERVACKIISKNLDGADPQKTAISVFKILRGYTTWEAKLVLILAAFAIKYGEFWLLVRSFSTDQRKDHGTPLARSIAVLRHVSVNLKDSNSNTILGNLTDWYDQKLGIVISKLLDATDLVVEFFKIGSKYDKVPSVETAKHSMPLQVNQIVLSILACMKKISEITDAGFDFTDSPSDPWTKDWEGELEEALKKLRGQLQEERETVQIYQTLKSHLGVSNPNGNIFSVLRAFIPPTEPKALWRISDKKKWEAEVTITNLPQMTKVLLFISNLKNENGARAKEIKDLEEIYQTINEESKKLYKLLWIPINEETPSENDENAFQEFAKEMKKEHWYSFSKLKHIHKGVIKFIKDSWSFKRKSILVVINQRGVVVNRDAFRMIRIWKGEAFPFDRSREANLWSQEPWNSDILIHHKRDSVIQGWVGDEDMYTFFCGGRDIKWLAYFLKEFKEAAKFVKKKSEEGKSGKVLLHTVYLGKNSKNIFDRAEGKLKSLADDIHCPKEDEISFLWKKLKSMKLSVSQQDAVKDDDAKKKKQGIQKLFSHVGGVGWVVLCKGTEIILNGYGSTMLALLEDFNKQETGKSADGFRDFFKNNYDSYEKDYGIYCSLDFPPNYNFSAEEQKCPHCGKYPMKKKINLYCSHK